jgi:hypothetical protein
MSMSIPPIYHIIEECSLFRRRAHTILLYLVMSCGKLDDLEDLAENVFDFGEEEQRQPRRERALKKQRKPKAAAESTTGDDREELPLEEHQVGIAFPIQSRSHPARTPST